VLKECVKLQHLHVGVERENFKIDCRSLFGVSPADIMHVERNVRLRHVCIRGSRSSKYIAKCQRLNFVMEKLWKN